MLMEIVWGNFAEAVTLKYRLNYVYFNCMIDSVAGCFLTKGILHAAG